MCVCARVRDVYDGVCVCARVRDVYDGVCVMGDGPCVMV